MPALCFAVELVRLSLRGHFQIVDTRDLQRAAGLGLLGYGLLALLEIGAFAMVARRFRDEAPRRAAQLAWTTLILLAMGDHVGRHHIDSPFAPRALALFAGTAAAALASAWILAAGVPRILPTPLRRVLSGPVPLLTLAAVAVGILLRPVREDGPARVPAPGSPNVILVSIDTARADYLSCYGHDAPTTPELDRVARDGIRFTNAYAQENWTLPSHATMLTSLYPPTHGVEDLDSRLAEDIRTVAEEFADAGYRTLGIVDGDRRSFVGASRGFDRGFDDYVHYPEVEGASQAFLPFRARADVRLFFEQGHSDEIVDAAIAWLEQRAPPDRGRPEPGRPFFLFLHIYDAHASWGSRWPIHRLPYQQHSEELAELGLPTDSPRDRFVRHGLSGARYLRAINRALDNEVPLDSLLSPQDIALLRGLYASSLRFVDGQLGRLDAFLSERGLHDSTILLVTSDHGEEFLEHGRFGHHQDHRETLRVPLLLRYPARIGRGQSCDTLVETVDLAPTLLALSGLEIPPAFQGRSLLPLLEGEPWDERPAYMGNQLDGIYGVRTRTFSYYVHGLHHTEPLREELYDVAADSLELHDLRALEPSTLDSARTLVGDWLRRVLADRSPNAGPTVPIDPQTRELLRSLGYTR
ncbi:MAG: sulfatase [Candidatus Eisenbacteria bacterium]|uniref:Sulfatase n=1 Tax=Eiseniibacteriota bacterium TaxID=2212470 RepID=A0A956LYP6_UNCEI|nr:sulfatase [Candidatus Eisenbacteria bacterium]